MGTSEAPSGAERMRRCRERRRLGVVCIARVPVYVLDIEFLVTRNRIEPDDQKDATKISAAIEALVDYFTESKLAAVNI